MGLVVEKEGRGSPGIDVLGRVDGLQADEVVDAELQPAGLVGPDGPDPLGGDNAGEGLAEVVVVAAEDGPDRGLGGEGDPHGLLLVDRERPQVALRPGLGHVVEKAPDGRHPEILADDDRLELLDRRDEAGLAPAQVERDASRKTLQVLVPIEEKDLELARGVFLAEEPDALEAEEAGVEDRPGHAVNLGVGLEDVELLFGQKISHLPRGPLDSFELGHEGRSFPYFTTGLRCSMKYSTRDSA